MKQNEKMFQVELTEFYPRLWRFCLTLSGARDRADDLAQLSFLKALEKQSQFKPDTRLDSWVFTIARNAWISEIRKQKVRLGNGVVEADEIDLPSEATQETNIIAREALSSVMELPEAQRETVMLVYIEGYSYKDAASLLSIPIGTVMSRLASARKTLSTKLNVEQ